MTCPISWAAVGVPLKRVLLHFTRSFTALWDAAKLRTVHSLMLSSHLFFCLLSLLAQFTVFARSYERKNILFLIVVNSSSHMYSVSIIWLPDFQKNVGTLRDVQGRMVVSNLLGSHFFLQVCCLGPYLTSIQQYWVEAGTLITHV